MRRGRSVSARQLSLAAWTLLVTNVPAEQLSIKAVLVMARTRWQIEFNFRDAKQYWGLEDFMNISPTAVSNAANLALFMVNLVERLLRDIREEHPLFSVLDLKAYCRGAKYVEETIKLLPETPEPVLLERIFSKIVGIGRIHALSAEPIPT